MENKAAIDGKAVATIDLTDYYTDVMSISDRLLKSVMPSNKPEVKNFKLSGGVNVINSDGTIHKVYLTKVIYSNPATIAFWSDGTKTSSKANELFDVYSCDAGLAICALKKMLGSDQTCDMLEFWTPNIDDLLDVCDNEEPEVITVTLKDVRKKEKAEGRLK